MEIIISIISIIFWFLVILVPLVIIHEFGHLLMARLVGIKVLEFGVGIPPRWKYKRWKGITWSLNYILLGGFVRILGDNDAIDHANELQATNPKKAKEDYIINRLDEILANKDLKFFLKDNSVEYTDQWKKVEEMRKREDKLTKEEEKEYLDSLKQLEVLIDWEYENLIESEEVFFKKSWPRKTVFLLGGVIFNIATAFLIFFVLFNAIGSPVRLAFPEDLKELESRAQITKESDNLVVLSVSEEGPAYSAGLRGGDEIISLGENDLDNVETREELSNIIAEYEDQETELVYKQQESGKTVSTTITPQKTNEKVVIGISQFGYPVTYSGKNFIEGTLLAWDRTSSIFIANFEILGDVVIAILPWSQDRSAIDSVGGPVAVSSFSSKIFDFQGMAGILDFIGTISVSLAVFNLLPIPALDGGRFIIITLNHILGKRNRKLEAVIINATFLLLLGLGLLIAVKDVQTIINAGI
jgi:regulator of sigma E protease